MLMQHGDGDGARLVRAALVLARVNIYVAQRSAEHHNIVTSYMVHCTPCTYVCRHFLGEKRVHTHTLPVCGYSCNRYSTVQY